MTVMHRFWRWVLLDDSDWGSTAGMGVMFAVDFLAAAAFYCFGHRSAAIVTVGTYGGAMAANLLLYGLSGQLPGMFPGPFKLARRLRHGSAATKASGR